MKDINDAGSRLDELLKAADAGDAIAVRSREGELTELALRIFDGVIRRIDIRCALRKGASPAEVAEQFDLDNHELDEICKLDAESDVDLLRELFHERSVIALGIAQRVRGPALPDRLLALRRGKGINNTLINELKAAIKKAAEVKPDAASGLGTLLRGIGDERLRKLECPAGWVCDFGGVWKDGENIARAPIVIRRITTDVERGTLRWTLCWRRDEAWVSADIDRRTAVDARAILELGGRGAPVSSPNASDLVRWLVDFEARNLDRLPAERSTGHLGWQDDETYLCSPADERVRVIVGDGEADVLRGWGAQDGTFEGWCDTIREFVAPYPRALLGIYAALVPVLLRPLREQGFTVDWSGDSSGGKTTTLGVAASVWGVPDLSTRGGIIRPWLSSSAVGPSATAAVLHSVPVFLDETQLMQTPKQREAVGAMLYGIQSGQESVRGGQDGKLRPARTWQTCMLSTGEAAITSFSGATGARARALCLRGRPFGDAGKEWVDDLKSRLAQHYGHLGPRFVELVVKKGPELLRVRYAELRTEWARGEDPLTARITGYVALLHMVAEMVHEELEVPGDSGAAMRLALEAARQGGEEADRPLEALVAVYSWCGARQDQFDGQRRPSNRPLQWLGRWESNFLAVSTVVLGPLLEELRYESENVLCSWRDRGWTACQGTRKDKLVKIDGAPHRSVVIRLDHAAVKAALGLP